MFYGEKTAVTVTNAIKLEGKPAVNRATRSAEDTLSQILLRHSRRAGLYGRSQGWQRGEFQFTRKGPPMSTNFSNCKSFQKEYADPREGASQLWQRPPETLPTGTRVASEASKLFPLRGQKARMALALQVISSHLLGVRDIENALSVHPALVKRLLPHAAGETDALKGVNSARLFLLDGCSLTIPLGPLSGRLRANWPGSKFLALLPPDRCSDGEMMLLFYWGIDGFMILHKKWKTELPKAALAILRGSLWVPSHVLLAFVRQTKALLDKQLLAGQSLTARESQVLQLLLRRLPNKEIAHQLNISERTAKFHVSNVLSKLGLETRKNLGVLVS